MAEIALITKVEDLKNLMMKSLKRLSKMKKVNLNKNQGKKRKIVSYFIYI